MFYGILGARGVKTMKKVYVLLFGVLVLSACSTNETATNSVSETSSSSETSVQSSESSSSEQTSETTTQSTEETSSEEDKENFPYAVNLNDFTQEAVPDDKKSYQRDFTTSQDNLPSDISVNTKDSDDFEKAIYITSSEGEDLVYPVSITSVPTKKSPLLETMGKNGILK